MAYNDGIRETRASFPKFLPGILRCAQEVGPVWNTFLITIQSRRRVPEVYVHAPWSWCLVHALTQPALCACVTRPAVSNGCDKLAASGLETLFTIQYSAHLLNECGWIWNGISIDARGRLRHHGQDHYQRFQPSVVPALGHALRRRASKVAMTLATSY
jgi:hypothetical protein